MSRNTIKKTNNRKDFAWGGVHQFFIDPFLSSFTPELKDKVILDVGCGKGMNGYLIRISRDLSGAKLIGMDINKGYLEFSRNYNIYNKLVHAKLPRLPFSDKSVDFLICCDVIEHLNKKDSNKLIKEIDRVCRERSIISTPNTLFDTISNENEDIHRSLWTARNFRMHGYRVYGLGIKTTILINDPLLKIKQALYYFFTPLSYFIPEIGGILLCVKNYV